MLLFPFCLFIVTFVVNASSDTMYLSVSCLLTGFAFAASIAASSTSRANDGMHLQGPGKRGSSRFTGHDYLPRNRSASAQRPPKGSRRHSAPAAAMPSAALFKVSAVVNRLISRKNARDPSLGLGVGNNLHKSGIFLGFIPGFGEQVDPNTPQDIQARLPRPMAMV